MISNLGGEGGRSSIDPSPVGICFYDVSLGQASVGFV